MKSKEELNALKEEVETVSRKPQALSDDELEQVTGGGNIWEQSTKKQVPLSFIYGSGGLDCLPDDGLPPGYASPFDGLGVNLEDIELIGQD